MITDRQTNKVSRPKKTGIWGFVRSWLPTDHLGAGANQQDMAFGPLGAGPDQNWRARAFPGGARRPAADQWAHSGRAFIVLTRRAGARRNGGLEWVQHVKF